MKKYFKTKKEALQARNERDPQGYRQLGIYKMPKGSRHVGMFAVCDYMTYLNSD